jgi:hypothetical protein
MSESEIKDVYYRRFFVPVVIALVFFAFVAVVLAVPPGSQLGWKTANSPFGNIGPQLGGFFRWSS